MTFEQFGAGLIILALVLQRRHMRSMQDDIDQLWEDMYDDEEEE